MRMSTVYGIGAGLAATAAVVYGLAGGCNGDKPVMEAGKGEKLSFSTPNGRYEFTVEKDAANAYRNALFWAEMKAGKRFNNRDQLFFSGEIDGDNNKSIDANEAATAANELEKAVRQAEAERVAAPGARHILR